MSIAGGTESRRRHVFRTESEPGETLSGFLSISRAQLLRELVQFGAVLK
jgi:hypothetical protein